MSAPRQEPCSASAGPLRHPRDGHKLTLSAGSTVISVFAIIILSILGGLYRSDHEEFMGGRDDPKDGKVVAGTIFTAVIVYAVRRRTNRLLLPQKTSADAMQAFLVFCSLQGMLHVRESRRGAISL